MPEENYDKKLDWRLWKKLLPFLGVYKKHLLILCICNLAIAAADIAFPLFARHAIDQIVAQGSADGIGVFLALLVLLAVVQGASVWIYIAVAGKLEMYLSYDVRRAAFRRLQELSFSYYDTTPVGYIMARMTSDVNRLSETISWALIDLLWAAAVLVGITGAMLVLDVRMTLLVLIVVPLLAIATIFFQRRILHQQRRVRQYNAQITGGFNEGIMGARTTKTLVREEENLQEFKEITGQMRRASVRAAILSSIFLPFVAALGTIGTALALWNGGHMVVIGALSLGTLSAFMNYALQFFEPIQQSARIFADLQSAQAAAERVLALLEEEPDVRDSDDARRRYGDLFDAKDENWPAIDGRIEFRNVSFSYLKGQEVLRDFSLTVEPGQTIALVGETGAGKSTIVNLVCRFYEPQQGSILLDGVDIREYSQLFLQSSLGYVLQAPHLFSGTIADNIRFGRADATDEMVRRAAALVSADTFIEQLPEKYDTQVGEGGGRLSTGEKQLISFARALVQDPRIFVLDEATSSIDTETEQMIQNAITASLAGRTSFIVAHRLSTIRSADKILVLREGVVQEQGTHEELMALQGYYYELYQQQFRREQEHRALGV